MIYDISLKTTGLSVGLALVLGHGIALIREKPVMAWLKAFPRCRVGATVLLSIAAVWSFLLTRSIDLGEFSPLRNFMLVAIVVGSVLTWLYVEEFLSVRALGMLLLLAADPILESAILREEPTRLLLVLLAYAWIVAGLFFVGMPYVMRDAITWVTSAGWRWRTACMAGLLWGAAITACAAFLW